MCSKLLYITSAVRFSVFRSLKIREKRSISASFLPLAIKLENYQQGAIKFIVGYCFKYSDKALLSYKLLNTMGSHHDHNDHHSNEKKPVSFTVPLIFASVVVLIIVLFVSLGDPK